MNAQQKQALEALAGRPIGEAEAAEIDALLFDGRHNAVAELLSVGRTKIEAHLASERGILERFPGGPLAADELLTKLEAFAVSGHPYAGVVKRAMRFLQTPEGLDIGSPTTLALLDQLAAGGVITADEAAGVKSIATVAAPLTAADIQNALRG